VVDWHHAVRQFIGLYTSLLGSLKH